MKFRLLILMLTTIMAASCASSSKFVYLNDMEPGEGYAYNSAYEPVIRPNDRLKIVVSCKQPELAMPFNIKGGSFRVNADGTSIQSAADDDEGYKVDCEGNIEFPILGKIHLDGLTTKTASETIQDMIIKGSYIKNPIVSIDFQNFKYTVWGAVMKNGTFTVDDGRITILEALANAGDLTQKARLDRVCVIRDVDGKKEIFYHDIRTSDILSSPCFYLQQNDIIYVEPKYAKADKGDRTSKFITVCATVVTAICSAIWAINSF